MSIFEYDKDEEERKLRKAEYEIGKQAGIQIGIEKERKNTEKERARADALEKELRNLKDRML